MQVSRVEEFELTVPAATLKTAPAVSAIEFNPGTIVRYELLIPDGPAGLSGVRLAAFGTQIMPNATGTWIVANNDKVAGEPYNWPNSGKLEWQAYNEDLNEHTYRLRLYLIENAHPSVTPTTEGGVTITVGATGELTGGGSTSGGGEQPPPPKEEPPKEEPPPPKEEPPAEEPPKEEPPPAEEAPPEEAPPTEAPPPEEAAPPEEAPPPEGEPAAEPEVVSSEAQPTTGSGAAHGKRKAVKHKVTHPPATKLHEAAERVSGHPELKRGVSVAVNLILKRWPRLIITSTTGGVHAAGSLHYKGEAADLAANDQTYMSEAASWIFDHLERYLTEGIHNPDLSVKDAKAVTSNYWGEPTWAEHLNHIHVGVAPPQEGELLKANKPTTTTVVEHSHGRPAKRAGKPEHGKQPAKRKQPEHKHAEHGKQPAKRKAPEHGAAGHKTPAHKPAKETAKQVEKRRAAHADILHPGETLQMGEEMKAPAKGYHLVMQTDGNLVLYGGSNKVLWTPYTQGHGADYLIMQTDGNLVVYNAAGELWNAGTQGHPGAELHVQDDGNLVIYQGAHPIWATNTAENERAAAAKAAAAPVAKPEKRKEPAKHEHRKRRR